MTGSGDSKTDESIELVIDRSLISTAPLCHVWFATAFVPDCDSQPLNRPVCLNGAEGVLELSNRISLNLTHYTQREPL